MHLGVQVVPAEHMQGTGQPAWGLDLKKEHAAGITFLSLLAYVMLSYYVPSCWGMAPPGHCMLAHCSTPHPHTTHTTPHI